MTDLKQFNPNNLSESDQAKFLDSDESRKARESLEKAEMAEELKSKLVWFIDDSSMNIMPLLSQIKFEKIDADCSYFQTGEKAADEFEERAKAKKRMPSSIFMDYTLDLEVKDPKYRTGVEVIEKLKAIAEEYGITLPEIIAFSTSQMGVDNLMQAGATRSANKLNIDGALDYMKEPL